VPGLSASPRISGSVDIVADEIASRLGEAGLSVEVDLAPGASLPDTVTAAFGMVVREGSGGHFHNMIIDSYGIEALDLRDEVATLVQTGRLTLSNNLIANTGKLGKGTDESGDGNDDYGFSESNWIQSPDNNNQQRLDSALHITARDPAHPNFYTRVQMRQMSAAQPPKSEFFDESATYVGALNPRLQSSWLEGWTAFPVD